MTSITENTILNGTQIYEVSKIGVMTTTGDSFTFEEVMSCGYDTESDLFVINHYDGSVTYLTRETLLMFTTFPEENDNIAEEKIVSIGIQASTEDDDKGE